MSSIGPIPPAASEAARLQEEQLRSAQQRQRSSASNNAAGESAQPDQGNSRIQQNLKINNASPPPQIPEDEVEVQWDTPMTDRIEIYQFLDRESGALTIQIPSAEVLGVAHGIQQELTVDASKEAASAAANEGGKHHGG